jgi:hypothetical protein
MNHFLAFADSVEPMDVNTIGTAIFIIVYGGLLALIIILLIRMARYFINAGKEQKLIRLELGKIAEEVQLIRKEIKQGKEQSNP